MVEWKKIGEVSNILYGYPFESSLFTEDSNHMPLIRIRDIKPAKASTYYSGACIDEYRIKKGDILVGMDGEFNLGRWNDRDGLLNQRVLKLTGKKNCCIAGYLYHYMGPVFKKIEKSTAGGSVKHLSAKVINNIFIPVPSLEEQERIVGILDTFTASIDNIKVQIEQRRKQYEHYRNTLLTFNKDDDSMEWKTLGEIGEIIRGNGLQKTDFVEEGVGCVHYGQIYTRLGFSLDKTLTFVPKELAEKLTTVEPSNLIIACTSENIEDVCKSVVWLGNENIVTGGHACVFKHHENPKYIGYCFLTYDFFNQKKKYAYGAKVIDIKTEKLSLIQIPLPSRKKQDEIVSILDTFEASITNLEAQLEQRQKQYEYYREELLTNLS